MAGCRNDYRICVKDIWLSALLYQKARATLRVLMTMPPEFRQRIPVEPGNVVGIIKILCASTVVGIVRSKCRQHVTAHHNVKIVSNLSRVRTRHAQGHSRGHAH